MLLAVDQDDVLLGATRSARQKLGLTESSISAGCCASDVLCEKSEDLFDAERAVLRRALTREGGNVTATARALGVSLATLKRRVRRHGLSRKA